MRISLPSDSFHRLVDEGKGEETSNLIDRDIRKVYETDHMCRMPLLVSVISGNEKMALKLIGKMPVRSLENINADVLQLLLMLLI